MKVRRENPIAKTHRENPAWSVTQIVQHLGYPRDYVLRIARERRLHIPTGRDVDPNVIATLGRAAWEAGLSVTAIGKIHTQRKQKYSVTKILATWLA